MQLRYKKRRSFKYTLAAPYLFECAINIDSDVNTHFIRLSKTGQLFINTAYSWDGASGPMPDLNCVMRASLIHDALYQLMREQHLPQSYRSTADRLLYELCLADGMNPILAKCVYFCVRQFGQRHAGNDLLVLNPRN